VDGFRHIGGGARTRFGALSLPRKVVLGAAAAAGLVGAALFAVWLQADDMAVLFSGLSPQDASATLVALSQQDIRTELRNGGTTILVPAKEVSRLRLDLAGRGIPPGGGGPAIPDPRQADPPGSARNPDDTRALEDELARSLETLQGIRSARVHLVRPGPTDFARNGAGATATVVLGLDGPAPAADDRIAGVQALVAAGVGNLAPEHVTVLDQHGRVLSRTGRDDDTARGDSPLALRKEVEGYLAQKATSMLDRVLGPGRSIVRVDATLNLEKVDREQETFDPSRTVVRSETHTESNDARDGTSEQSETSYEINRTVERIVGQAGGISGLSVAVFVDGHYGPAADGGAPVYQPLSDGELDQLERIVRTTVGLNAGRGDRIEVVNMPFRQPEELSGPGTGVDWVGLANRYGGRILLLVALAAVLVTLRRNVGRLLDESPGGDPAATAAGTVRGSGPAAAAAPDEPELEHFDGIPEATHPVVEEIQDYAAENPERVAEVIQAWIQDIDLAGGARKAVGG